MNFVGHAYIARNNLELVAGNFAGDYYKGNLENFIHLPAHILNGVYLHRFIDDFTDTSPIIKGIGKRFQAAGVRKVAYIATDIILDHYITKNWSNYSDIPFKNFVKIVYNKTDENLVYLEEDFCFMYNRLKEQKWLFQYHTEEGIEMILWQFSRRIGFKNDLTKCMDIYREQRSEIDEEFKKFMDAIVENSEKFITELLQ